MRTFPIYLLELNAFVVCVPEGQEDIDHSVFWETIVSGVVAEHFKIPQRLLLNLPYCQRRARVAGKRIYYGETHELKLLRLIRKTLANKQLVFVHDDHEKRLEYDVSRFKQLVERHCPKSTIT